MLSVCGESQGEERSMGRKRMEVTGSRTSESVRQIIALLSCLLSSNLSCSALSPCSEAPRSASCTSDLEEGLEHACFEVQQNSQTCCGLSDKNRGGADLRTDGAAFIPALGATRGGWSIQVLVQLLALYSQIYSLQSSSTQVESGGFGGSFKSLSPPPWETG